jgi:uncharacterized iron-regulated protein
MASDSSSEHRVRAVRARARCSGPRAGPLVATLALLAALAACSAVPPGRTGAGHATPAPPDRAAADRDAAGAPDSVLALAPEPGAIADAMRGAPVVLLGEFHDNPAHHALRTQALARLVSAGARPAIAFEQFDRERQADLDAARRERPRDPDALIARAGGPGWDWPLYRPLVALALEHELPIVAANLSRAEATRVVREGIGAAFDAPLRAQLGLDTLPAALLDAHAREVDAGHCGLMPAAMLGPMARAQIARDVALAQAIAPHAQRGVVLIAGNGHVRRDLGVPRWLPTGQPVLAIGFFERDARDAPPTGAFDRVVTTAGVARTDPCEALRARRPASAPAPAPPPAPPDAAPRPAPAGPATDRRSTGS